jgi:hypothetical protein
MRINFEIEINIFNRTGLYINQQERVYCTSLKSGVFFNGKNTVSVSFKVKFPGNYLSFREELTRREKNL